MEEQSSNKRIAKNTVALYFRMIITMLVGLFTSRIILQALGVEDYGIYNVVGGFVAIFSMISGSLTSAISRYITFELGRANIDKLRIVFSTSILVQIGLGVIIILIGETVGLWFLYNKMVIPEARLDAAFWVFQFAILTFIINLLSTPYNACIISHERMNAFAYISIYEVICKLLICYAVMYSPIDRLVCYAILLFCVGVSVRIVYALYCKKYFEECNFRYVLDKELLKRMFSFAGWNFIGSAGWVLRAEGGTILFNLFGGPTINAANGIAAALSGVVTGFVTNFTMAFNPQITKDYAAKKYEDLNLLLIYGPKISFYMMLFMAVPVILNTHFILYLWLGIVPEHTVTLVQLILLFALTETISTPLITAKLATGDIRNYQIVVGSVQLLSLPLAYISLKLGAPIECVYVAYIVTAIGCFAARLFMLRGDIPGFSLRRFFIDVFLNVWMVAIISVLLPYAVHLLIPEGWLHFFATCVVSVFSSSIVIIYIGLRKSERQLLYSKLEPYIKKLKK
jgi:O-antigen/teichoic acid export membrane protein